jgi:hypothetical protein
MNLSKLILPGGVGGGRGVFTAVFLWRSIKFIPEKVKILKKE